MLDRVTVEIARGTPHGRDRDRYGGGGGRDRGGRGGSPRGRDRPVWMDKYGPPTRTDYKLIVENLSSRVSWQVRIRNEITFYPQNLLPQLSFFLYKYLLAYKAMNDTFHKHVRVLLAHFPGSDFFCTFCALLASDCVTCILLQWGFKVFSSFNSNILFTFCTYPLRTYYTVPYSTVHLP